MGPRSFTHKSCSPLVIETSVDWDLHRVDEYARVDGLDVVDEGLDALRKGGIT
jgi:hypothetical protein